MAAPNASAAIWETFIQQPAIVCLETLLSQIQETRGSDPSFEIPTIKVYKDRFHLDRREQATAMLGLDFSATVPDSPTSSSISLPSSSSSQSDCIAMTVLQYSILTLFAGQPEDANQRELVIEMLVKNLSPEEINGQVFGDGNNALHLAAFLNMESTLHVLIAFGGSPLLANGRGLSAFDILFEVTPAGLAPPSLRPHRASYPCSFKENVAPATITLTRAASVASSIKRAHSSEIPHFASVSYPHQPFSSTTSAHVTHENTYRSKNEIEGEPVYSISTPVRSSADCEFVGDSDSLELELELDDGPQDFQQTENGDKDSLDDYLVSRDALGRSLISDNKAFADGYDHDDLDIFDCGNNAHLVEKDAQDMDPYYFHHNGLELQFLQEQLELDEFESQKIHLHEDLTCFLRIRSGPSLIANGAHLVSILKNRHAWRPQDLSIEHAQSFEAYEDYTERLQLQRKPDDFHIDDLRHQASYEKTVQWNNIKQVREYQRHMNCQLDMDGWDGLLVSEPYDEPVDDSFVPTASPYDIVRPVTPVRPRSHALSMNINNSRLDLSRADVTGRTSSPLPHGADRPLPDIPQSVRESAISSFFGYRKGTPPPPSVSKARTTVVGTVSSPVPSQANDQVKPASSRPFSKRLSATSLLWNSKRPGSPFSKMPFSSSDIQLRTPTMTSSSDGVLSEFAPGQRDSTEYLPSLATDSSQWMPRMLRSLTSPPNSLSKARSRSSLDSSQSIPKTQTVQELLLQGAPFSIDPDLSHRGKRSTIVDYDTIFPGSILSSSTTTSTTTTTPKMFAQLKSALREKFGTPTGSLSHELTPIPRCISTPPFLPPIPVSQSPSEPSSPNTNTIDYNREWPTFPVRDSSLDRRSSNSSAISDTSVTGDDKHEGSKVFPSLQQRRPSTPSDLVDATIRAHIPRVTSPLVGGSSMRSTTRSPQLYPPKARPSESDAEDAEAEKTGDDQTDFLIRGPRAASTFPQEFPQPADSRQSLTGFANQFLGSINSSADLTSHMSITDIREDPNRPALPDRPSSRSGSYSSTLSLSLPQAQAATASLSHRHKPSETSVTKHGNWKKRKEVAALVHPPRTSSLPSGPLPAPAQPLEQQQDLLTTPEGLRMEEVPTCSINDHGAGSKVVEILDTSAFSDTESVPTSPLSPVAIFFPLQHKDSRVKHYQDMLVKSTELAARTKPQYVLPELVFSADSSEEMEYIHGVTHATSSALITDIQDESKGSLLEAALVNIQGISHGLEVQKYNLRQSTVVERFSDVDQPLSALSLTEPSHQLLYHERYASLWMDLSKFESRPRRSTLSTCNSPSTTQTGILYLRFKKICNFSLPLPGENTMVSIRIDTGYEKVDTDYVPLEDVDMIINQEFCLPVCPGLAITITLHLMQAPHLQPRYHQQHLPTAVYSSLPRATCNNNSAAYTINPHVSDRPPSASPYVQKSLPALPPPLHHQKRQQHQDSHIPTTATTGSVFNSIGKKSLLSSIFNKRSQPSSPSSSAFGAANFGIFNYNNNNNNNNNNNAPPPPTRPGSAPGWRRPSSPQVLLNEDPLLHGAKETTSSLIGSIGHRSNHATFATTNAVSLPRSINNHSRPSSSTTIGRLATPSPLPTSNSPTPPTRAASTPPLGRFLQHSGSSSSTSTSTSTSESESSLSTPPSSCGSIDSTHEGDTRKSGSGNAFAKWTKGFLTSARKKSHSQSKQQQQQGSRQLSADFTMSISSGLDSSRSVNPMLPSSSATIGAVQQQLSMDQEQWLSYWKSLGEQHRKGSIGSSAGPSSPPRSSSFLHAASGGLGAGIAPFSTDSSLYHSNQRSSDIIASHNIDNVNNTNNNTNAATNNDATINNSTTNSNNNNSSTTNDNDSNNNSNNNKNNNLASNTPVPFLSQLSQAQIRATESPLEILSRHILFDDELCIARTGIVFSEIRAACTNQIVNIEFQTVNNWIDLNDYSRVGGQLGQGSPSVIAKDSGKCMTPGRTGGHGGNSDNDHNDANDGEDDEEEEESGSPDRDTMVANIQTTVCFIPGLVMDPEDAIYEEQEPGGDRLFIPTEPQNLVDCHMGLKYFHWQDRVSFCGPLFYSTAIGAESGYRQRGPSTWREGRFCIIGSVLWQCRLPNPRASSCHRRFGQMENGQDQEEKWRCLDLSLVQGIETSLGYFSARARYLEPTDIDHGEQQQEHQTVSVRVRDVSEDYYPVRNGFRLCMAQTNDQAKQRTVFDMEFYAESAEMGQRWVSALMEACRERPAAPYWMAPSTA